MSEERIKELESEIAELEDKKNAKYEAKEAQEILNVANILRAELSRLEKEAMETSLNGSVGQELDIIKDLNENLEKYKDVKQGEIQNNKEVREGILSIINDGLDKVNELDGSEDLEKLLEENQKKLMESLEEKDQEIAELQEKLSADRDRIKELEEKSQEALDREAELKEILASIENKQELEIDIDSLLKEMEDLKSSEDDNEDRIASLEEELKIKQENLEGLEELEEEKTSLEAELEEIRLGLDEAANDELEELRATIEDLLDEINRKTEEKELEKKASEEEWNKKLEESNTTVQELKQALEDANSAMPLTAELQKLNDELSLDKKRLEKEILKLKEDLDEARQDLELAGIDNKELVTSIDELRADLEGKNSELEDIKSELNTEDDINSNLKAIKDLKYELENSQEAYRELSIRIKFIVDSLGLDSLDQLESKIGDMKSRLEEAEADLEKAKLEDQEKNRTIEKLRSELEARLEELKEIKAGLDQGEDPEALVAKIEKLTNELTNTNQDLDSLRKSLKEANQKISSLEDAKAKLDEQVADLRAANKSLAEAKKTIEGEKAEVEKAKKDLEADKTKSEEEKQEALAELNKKAEELSEKETKLEKTKESLKDTKAKLDEIVNGLEGLGENPTKEELEAKVEEIKANEEELKKVKTELEKLQKELAQKDSQIFKLEKELEEAKANLGKDKKALEEKISEQGKALEKAEKDLADANNLSKKEKTELQKTIKEQKEALEEAKKKADALDEVLKDLPKDATKDDIANKLKEIKEASEKVAGLNDQLKDLQAKLAQKDSQISKLEKELEEAKANLGKDKKALEEKISEQGKALEKAEKDLADANNLSKKEKTELQKTIKEQKEALEEAKKKADALDEVLKDLPKDATKDDIANKLKEIKAEAEKVADLNEEINKLNNKLKNLQTELDQKDSQISKLELKQAVYGDIIAGIISMDNAQAKKLQAIVAKDELGKEDLEFIRGLVSEANKKIFDEDLKELIASNKKDIKGLLEDKIKGADLEQSKKELEEKLALNKAIEDIKAIDNLEEFESLEKALKADEKLVDNGSLKEEIQEAIDSKKDEIATKTALESIKNADKDSIDGIIEGLSEDLKNKPAIKDAIDDKKSEIKLEEINSSINLIAETESKEALEKQLKALEANDLLKDGDSFVEEIQKAIDTKKYQFEEKLAGDILERINGIDLSGVKELADLEKAEEKLDTIKFDGLVNEALKVRLEVAKEAKKKDIDLARKLIKENNELAGTNKLNEDQKAIREAVYEADLDGYKLGDKSKESIDSYTNKLSDEDLNSQLKETIETNKEIENVEKALIESVKAELADLTIEGDMKTYLEKLVEARVQDAKYDEFILEGKAYYLGLEEKRNLDMSELEKSKADVRVAEVKRDRTRNNLDVMLDEVDKLIKDLPKDVSSKLVDKIKAIDGNKKAIEVIKKLEVSNIDKMSKEELDNLSKALTSEEENLDAQVEALEESIRAFAKAKNTVSQELQDAEQTEELNKAVAQVELFRLVQNAEKQARDLKEKIDRNNLAEDSIEAVTKAKLEEKAKEGKELLENNKEETKSTEYTKINEKLGKLVDFVDLREDLENKAKAVDMIPEKDKAIEKALDTAKDNLENIKDENSNDDLENTVKDLEEIIKDNSKILDGSAREEQERLVEEAELSLSYIKDEEDRAILTKALEKSEEIFKNKDAEISVLFESNREFDGSIGAEKDKLVKEIIGRINVLGLISDVKAVELPKVDNEDVLYEDKDENRIDKIKAAKVARNIVLRDEAEKKFEGKIEKLQKYLALDKIYLPKEKIRYENIGKAYKLLKEIETDLVYENLSDATKKEVADNTGAEKIKEIIKAGQKKIDKLNEFEDLNKELALEIETLKLLGNENKVLAKQLGGLISLNIFEDKDSTVKQIEVNNQSIEEVKESIENKLEELKTYDTGVENELRKMKIVVNEGSVKYRSGINPIKDCTYYSVSFKDNFGKELDPISKINEMRNQTKLAKDDELKSIDENIKAKLKYRTDAKGTMELFLLENSMEGEYPWAEQGLLDTAREGFTNTITSVTETMRKDNILKKLGIAAMIPEKDKIENFMGTGGMVIQKNKEDKFIIEFNTIEDDGSYNVVKPKNLVGFTMNSGSDEYGKSFGEYGKNRNLKDIEIINDDGMVTRHNDKLNSASGKQYMIVQDNAARKNYGNQGIYFAIAKDGEELAYVYRLDCYQGGLLALTNMDISKIEPMLSKIFNGIISKPIYEAVTNSFFRVEFVGTDIRTDLEKKADK